MSFDVIVFHADYSNPSVKRVVDRFQESFGAITLDDGTILKVKYHFFEDSEISYKLIKELREKKLITTAAPLYVALQGNIGGRPDWEVTDLWVNKRNNSELISNSGLINDLVLIKEVSDVIKGMNAYPKPPPGKYKFEVLYIDNLKKEPLTDIEKKHSPKAIEIIEKFVKNEFVKFTQSTKDSEENKKIDSLNAKIKQLEDEKNKEIDLLKAKVKKLEAGVKESGNLMKDIYKTLENTTQQNKELKRNEELRRKTS